MSTALYVGVQTSIQVLSTSNDIRLLFDNWLNREGDVVLTALESYLETVWLRGRGYKHQLLSDETSQWNAKDKGFSAS